MDNIFIQIIILIIGFIILIKGADWLVSGASSTALNFKVSKMLIGLTIVAFGTGAPELAVSISSLVSGNSDMLLGNIIGSNILNIMLLIGIGALIHPILVNRASIRKELILLLVSTVTLVILFLDTVFTGASINTISRADALICLLLFGIFLFFIIKSTRSGRKEKKKRMEKPAYKLGKSIILTLVGLAGVVVGSQFVVNSASSIATSIGISDRIIALTVVAFGTSLPELITTITAAKRGENELLIGNIIGSNIFNICIVLGIPAFIAGTIVPTDFAFVDLVMLLASVIILYLVTIRDRKITRLEGTMMLLIFATYYGYIIYGALA